MSSERRTEILEQATRWVTEHGLHGLSLRPLAAEIGTSARMLVYHFGSKEQLTASILELIAAQWMAALQSELDADVPLDAALEKLWANTLRDPANRDVHVLALEAWAIGLSSKEESYAPFLTTVASGWVDLIARWLSREAPGRPLARARATFLVAAIEGLLLHQLTDATLPVDAAFEQLITWLRRELGE